METLYESWAKRNPSWEKRYQNTVIDVFCDYAKGVSNFTEARGKIYGAGYEIFIIAFFIGIYHNRRKPLIEDRDKKKVFGQPIQYWGNIENRVGRTSYGNLRSYIFAALIAKTDIDFIALDKNEISLKTAVDKLMVSMEEFANYGFDYIEDKLANDQNYYFRETAFLSEFTDMLVKSEAQDEDFPESLD